jgi:hypothetical protein
LQDVDSKSPPSIGKCYEYNHSRRKEFILWHTIIANMDKAQCTIGVKLQEHYRNGFLRLAFTILSRDLLILVIQYDVIHLGLHTTMTVCIQSTMARELVIYPPSAILISLWCPRFLTALHLMLNKAKNKQASYGYAGQDQKRQNDDDIINKPSLKPKENSHLGISTLIPLSKLTDEMDTSYILHLLPSQDEESSNKWA